MLCKSLLFCPFLELYKKIQVFLPFLVVPDKRIVLYPVLDPFYVNILERVGWKLVIKYVLSSYSYEFCIWDAEILIYVCCVS